MANFSDRDLDRFWSQEELKRLSEKDLTKLAFLRNFKNLIFFGFGAIVVSYIASGFGTVGTLLMWISIVVMVLLTPEPLIAFFTTLISLIAPAPGRGRKLVQLVVSGLSVAFYATFALLIYARINDIDLMKYIIVGG